MDRYIRFIVSVILTLIALVLFWTFFGPFICLLLLTS